MPKILLLLVFWGLLAAAPVRAEDMSLYDAEISVDVTSENASVAREKAMSEANRQALMLVAGRLTTKEGASVLNHLNDNQVLNFIKEVTVESEKVSDVRYLAQLKISINGDILKAYLSEKMPPSPWLKKPRSSSFLLFASLSPIRRCFGKTTIPGAGPGRTIR